MSEIKYQLFYKVDEPYGWCSNFYQLEKGLDIDGEKWSDVESYFQAMKFRKSGLLRGFRSLDYSLLIRRADSPSRPQWKFTRLNKRTLLKPDPALKVM